MGEVIGGGGREGQEMEREKGKERECMEQGSRGEKEEEKRKKRRKE